ncbi:MAG: GxxExxY protein, partial [Calditrichaeota bacterium]
MRDAGAPAARTGFLESVYQTARAYELEKAGIPFEKEKALPVQYDNIQLEVGFRC